MKKIQNTLLVISILTVLTSCQSPSAQVKDLSNNQLRNEIIGAIAADSMMSNEMIVTMMNNKKGMMMMHQQQIMTMGNQSEMMNLLKSNPETMHSTMSAMMETAIGDTAMMSEMINTMMKNQQMNEMMQNRMMNSGMNGMNRMGGMEH
jgi:hypothetical protein